MKIKPLVAWYDLWIGAFYDRKNRRLYLLPLPCIGIVIQFGAREMFPRLFLTPQEKKELVDQYRHVEPGEHWNTISDGVVVILKDRSSRVDVAFPSAPTEFAGSVDKRHLTTQFHVNMRAQGMRLRTGGT